MAGKASSALVGTRSRTEAARVVQGQQHAGIGFDQQMIMRPERVGRDPPAARHAKMKEQGVAAIGFDQPVFRAPAKPDHPSAGQPLATGDGRSEERRDGKESVSNSHSWRATVKSNKNTYT